MFLFVSVFCGLFCLYDWFFCFFLLSFCFVYLLLKFGFGFFINSFFIVDGVGGVFVLLTFFVVLVSVLSSVSDFIGGGLFGLFAFLSSVSGTVLCFSFIYYSLFGFYFLFESVFLLFFLVLLGWGYSPERLGASFYMLFYTLFVSFPFLVSILSLGYVDFFCFFYSSFGVGYYFWVLFLLVFFVKVPVYFVHLWLPKAHVEAPVAGSMVLAGVLLKLGIYGVIRVFLFVGSLFDFFFGYVHFFVILGGIFVGFVCFRQVDLKALVAYSSVCHMSFCLVSFFVMSSLGCLGGMVVVVSHGFVSSCLFSLLFVFYCRSGSRSLFFNKGILWSFPVLGIWWFFFVFLNIGVPPSLGFFGEVFITGSLIGSWFFNFFLVFFYLLVVGLYGVILFFGVGHNDGISFSTWVGVMVREYLVFFFHFVPCFFVVLSVWGFLW